MLLLTKVSHGFFYWELSLEKGISQVHHKNSTRKVMICVLDSRLSKFREGRLF